MDIKFEYNDSLSFAYSNVLAAFQEHDEQKCIDAVKTFFNVAYELGKRHATGGVSHPTETITPSDHEAVIDWEQRRYEIARAALVGELASPVVEGIDPNPSVPTLVKHTVLLADALISELKKQEGEK